MNAVPDQVSAKLQGKNIVKYHWEPNEVKPQEHSTLAQHSHDLTVKDITGYNYAT